MNNKLNYIMNVFVSFLQYKLRFKRYGWKTIIMSPKLQIHGKKYISLGSRVFIHKNARIEAVTQYGNKRYKPSIIIDDNVSIQQNFHCTCANSIKIGEGTSITANVGIFDIIHPYDDISKNPRETDIQYKSIQIGENCLIGMNSVLLPGTKLGNHCIVGANSTVSGIFPDYTVIVGSPAKIVKYYSSKENKWLKR